MGSRVEVEPVKICSESVDVNGCVKHVTRAVINLLNEMENDSVQQDIKNDDGAHFIPEFHYAQYLDALDGCDEPAGHRSEIKEIPSTFEVNCCSVAPLHMVQNGQSPLLVVRNVRKVTM